MVLQVVLPASRQMVRLSYRRFTHQVRYTPWYMKALGVSQYLSPILISGLC